MLVTTRSLKVGFATVAVCLLISCQAALADFSSQINLTSNLTDPTQVQGGTPVEIYVACMQSYATSNPGNDITRLQLNWVNSSTGLSLSAATWTWQSDTNLAGLLTDDADMSDLIVNRQGGAMGGLTASQFSLGTLSFNAPLVDGTYTLDLGAGTGTGATLVRDGVTYSSLSLGSYSFTVPEPASLSLLALGGFAAIRRRKITSAQMQP